MTEMLKSKELGSTRNPPLGFRVRQSLLEFWGRVKLSIDFDAIDGKPIDVVFFSAAGAFPDEQINALASVARKLRGRETLHASRMLVTMLLFTRSRALVMDTVSSKHAWHGNLAKRSDYKRDGAAS